MKQLVKITRCFVLVLLLMTAQSAPALPSAGAALAGEADFVRGNFRYAGLYSSAPDSVLDYMYSDSHFSEDERVYNPCLSTMLLCFETSSWSSSDQENRVDKTVNTRNLLTDIGFEDFARNDFGNASPTVSSIGTVAARRPLGDATLIALAVRGGYFSEWAATFSSVRRTNIPDLRLPG